MLLKRLCDWYQWTCYNAKIKDIKGETSDNTNIVTTVVLTVVKNKILGVNTFVEKSNYVTTISEMEKKYLTTFDYNKFTNNILDPKITQKS